MEASERIHALLKKRNITAADAARDLDISKSTFTAWGNKPTSNIGGDIIIKFATYFDVSCDYLLRGKEFSSDEAIRKSLEEFSKYEDLIAAYESADKKSRNIVNTALDLPIEK